MNLRKFVSNRGSPRTDSEFHLKINFRDTRHERRNDDQDMHLSMRASQRDDHDGTARCGK